MSEQEIKKAIVETTKLVEAWPEWKQHILRDSARPTISQPREPVKPATEEMTQGEAA